MSVGDSLAFCGIHFSCYYGVVHMSKYRYLYKLVDETRHINTKQAK